MKTANKFTRIIILCAIAFLALIVLYALLDYQRRLNGFSQALYYAGLPIIGLILSTAALRLPETYKINLVLVLGSIVFALYLVEGALIVYSYLPQRQLTPLEQLSQAAEQAGVPFDTRTAREVYEQYEQEGRFIVPFIPPAGFIMPNHRLEIDGQQIVPLGGISNATTLFCNEGGEYIIYESDEHGLNNPKGLYSVQRLDIAAVGDSFTHGSCVKAEKNAVGVIRNSYKNTLNLGYAANGPLMELATLKEFAAPMKPAIVLWFYFEGNDLLNLEKEKESDLLRRYLEKDYSQGILSLQSQIDQAFVEFVERTKTQTDDSGQIEEVPESPTPTTYRSLRGFLLLRNSRKLTGLHPKVPPGIPMDAELFRQVLVEARDATKSWDGELYFVYLPYWKRFKTPNLVNRRRDAVLDLVNDLDIPVIDVYEAFMNHPDPLSLFPFRQHAHYNEEGYKLVGETVLQFIELENVLDQ